MLVGAGPDQAGLLGHADPRGLPTEERLAAAPGLGGGRADGLRPAVLERRRAAGLVGGRQATGHTAVGRLGQQRRERRGRFKGEGDGNVLVEKQRAGGSR